MKQLRLLPETAIKSVKEHVRGKLAGFEFRLAWRKRRKSERRRRLAPAGRQEKLEIGE